MSKVSQPSALDSAIFGCHVRPMAARKRSCCVSRSPVQEGTPCALMRAPVAFFEVHFRIRQYGQHCPGWPELSKVCLLPRETCPKLPSFNEENNEAYFETRCKHLVQSTHPLFFLPAQLKATKMLRDGEAPPGSDHVPEAMRHCHWLGAPSSNGRVPVLWGLVSASAELIHSDWSDSFVCC